MIENADAHASVRPLSRRLLASGLGFWGVSVGGSFVPGALRAILYPNHASALRVELVPADPLGATFLWSFFAVWCVSWAFVAGYAAVEWAARQARPLWAARALLLASLASPLAFALAMSVLVRLATRDAWHANAYLPFLPAAAVQLVVSYAYSVLLGLHPRPGLARGEGEAA